MAPEVEGSDHVRLCPWIISDWCFSAKKMIFLLFIQFFNDVLFTQTKTSRICREKKRKKMKWTIFRRFRNCSTLKDKNGRPKLWLVSIPIVWFLSGDLMMALSTWLKKTNFENELERADSVKENRKTILGWCWMERSVENNCPERFRRRVVEPNVRPCLN